MDDIKKDDERAAKVQSKLADLLEHQGDLWAFYQAEWGTGNDAMGLPVPSPREARILNSTREQLEAWVIESMESADEPSDSEFVREVVARVKMRMQLARTLN